MVELKRISINALEYNAMIKIAKAQGFLYPEGHKDVGKMISRKVVEYLIRNFTEPIA